MVERKTIVMAAFVGLLMSINVLYGMITLEFTPERIQTEAFLVASICWIIGYVYSVGDTWGEAQTVGKGLMATSWALLVGMEFTQFVPDLIASNGPWAGAAAVLIHISSFYMTGFKK